MSIARALGYESLVLGAWGCGAFGNDPHPTAKLLGGGQGIPIAEFLQAPASHWLSDQP